MHHDALFVSEKEVNPAQELSKAVISIGAIIVVGTFIKIGQIYFEKFLNENRGLQITPTIPKIQVEQIIKLDIPEAEFYRKDNRHKKQR